MSDARPTASVELRVNPLLARKGEPTSVFEEGRLVLLFHSEAECAVWLDSMRELGMQG